MLLSGPPSAYGQCAAKISFPIVLGHGKKLFRDGVKPAAFRLLDSKVSTTGITIARYQRAGVVVTGDYAMDPPTTAKVARRERMNRETT